MIDLTPLEVRLKKGDFRRAMRGYDVELVDDFLDLISDRMEELVKQNRTLSESVEALEAEVASYRNKERALSDALMTAQRLREDAKAHAEKEGELMLREARLAAQTARDEATKALVREEEAYRQARARRAQLIASFRQLLQRELTELDVIEEALELRDPGERAGDAQDGAGRAGSPTAGADQGAASAAPGEGPGREVTQASAAAGNAGSSEGPERPEAGTGEGEHADEVYAGESAAEAADPAAAQSRRPATGEAERRPDDEESEDDWLSSLVEE